MIVPADGLGVEVLGSAPAELRLRRLALEFPAAALGRIPGRASARVVVAGAASPSLPWVARIVSASPVRVCGLAPEP